jgi:hypothetical protein
MKDLPIQIKIVFILLIVVILLTPIYKTYNSTITLYNDNKELEFSYVKLTQEQISNYDGYYLAFTDKQANANINKETFIQVTHIIMNNRKDGQNVAWKWMQENQQIPYHEFTYFYKELSAFISIRYADNMKIERSKQCIIQQQNLLLSKFPNNVINKFLKIELMNYKAGYISETTKSKFK